MKLLIILMPLIKTGYINESSVVASRISGNANITGFVIGIQWKI